VLVVSYFVASKLDRLASIFLLGVYSLFAIGMTNEIVGLYLDLARLAWEIAQYSGSNGTAFSWHGMASSLVNGPPWVIPIVVGSMCGLAFLGSIFFFIRIRKYGSHSIL
jgi:hypothetical protein